MPSPSIALDTFATFGDLLKYLRRRARLTQLELSIAVGYSEAQISRLEKNQRLPDLTALQALFIPALHLDHEPEITTRLLALAQSARQEDAPILGMAPYKGLLFFDEPDADMFFGRETLTTHLIERVKTLAQSPLRLLAIVGASGSGKSSVVRAGLAVALKRAGWDTRVFTPTAQPLKIVEVNLAHDNANHAPILFIVDQFEEVFTLCREETARAAFIEQLLASANESNGRITTVLAVRADFYSHCAQYPQLRQAIAAQQEYIGQMTRDELRCAIEEPAKRGGWEFEPGLVDLMLSDIGAGSRQDQEPGALPLLSHALLATWEQRHGRTFTLAGYRAVGGVRGAIAETAQSVFTDQLNQQQQRLARDIFLRLTELGEGTEDTRRRASLSELVPHAEEETQMRAVLNILAEARLVMLSADSAEVAHEALIREWSQLREWLNENREGLRLQRHLTEAAQSWDKSDRDVGELYRGARLAQAREWAEGHTEELNDLEREFLGASQQMREREMAEREAQRQRELSAAQKLAEAERRRAKILRWGMIGVLLLLVVMIGLAVFASSQRLAAERAQADAIAQRDNAEDERRIAFARELAGSSLNNLDIDPERSILLALQAVAVSTTGGKSVLLEAQEALHRAVLASRLLLTLRGHTSIVYWIAYSPDGRRLVTGSIDKTAKIWDASTGRELLTLSGHTAGILGVAFSPDGSRVATASADKTAKVWDATTGKQLLTLAGHTDQVWVVAFSPDGRRIATASADHTAKLWDSESGMELLTLSGHTDIIRGMVFSPDGSRLYTGSYDRTAKAWDVTTGKELFTFAGHTSAIWSIGISTDGTRLATGAFDTTAKIWDALSGRQLLNLTTGGSTQGIEFNKAGTLLATCLGDGTATLWDVASGQKVLVLRGHNGPALGCIFNPDPQAMRLATASTDTTARVWDISPGGEHDWLTFAGHSARVHDVVYSPDGKYIASASADKTAKVWDATTGVELLTLTGHTNWVRAVAFSPDGRRLATTADDSTAKVWDLSTGKVLLILPDGPPMQGLRDHSVAFSPDGKRLVITSDNNTAKVWDASTGNELLTLSGHAGLIATVAYSPDGKRIATSSQDRTSKVWDASTGKELLTLSGSSGSQDYELAFSPDGTRIVTAGIDGAAKVWDAITGKLLLTLSGHGGVVLSAAFSPDGTHLATGSGDKTVKIWNLAQSEGQTEQPLTLYGATSTVFGVAFSPDGKRLAAGSIDGLVRVYALPLEDIIAVAKSRVTRTLTTDECQKFLHVDQCPAYLH